MTPKVSALIILFLLLFISFSVPFLLYHDGLPTGDAQKSIIWANQILKTKSLPDYSLSNQLLNRDPVDFYTPGLHVFTALIMGLATWLSLNPLTSVGLLAILFSLAAAFIAAAIAQQIFPKKTHPIFLLLPIFFTLTHFRFLRYLREPGYHFQNIAGELLLFALLLLSLRLIKEFRVLDAFFFLLAATILALTHQFSAFIAAFALLPALIIFIIKNKKYLTHFLIGLLLIIITAIIFGLQQKIPHLFTTTPHLLHLTPDLLDYPQTMGRTWFLAGIAGLALMIVRLRGDKHTLAFIASTFVILALSQGPRLGLDIPPVRALLYSIIPLSITAAYFVMWLTQHVHQIQFAAYRRLAFIILILLIIIPAVSSTAKAYNLSHTVRTNSTLTNSQLILVDFLKNKEGGAVLIDDYNRRSASWLVLSGHPMFTRIASDLGRQMDEARQSEERRNLYLKQLDFEKIFSLASQPEITQLMNKHNITWLTGIAKSSHTGFQYNPSLTEVTRAGDIILYKGAGKTPGVDGETPGVEEAPTPWLLRTSTLANDIGDNEDTYEHLQASLRSTRLSEPQFDGQKTFRTTTAPLIPLHFNIGDYVSVLWDKEKTGRPDTSLELMVKATASTPVQIITLTGTRLPLPFDGTPVKINASDVPFDDKGFITIIIDNPLQQPINIDLIALGPARTP